MSCKKINTFFAILILSCLSFYSQNKDSKWYLIKGINETKLSAYDASLLDSTLKVYHTTSNDSIQLYCLNYLSEKLEDEKIWPLYSELIIERTKTLRSAYYIKLCSTANNNLGLHQFNSGNVKPAFKYFQLSLHMDSVQNNFVNMANTLMNMGYVLEKTGNVKASEYYSACVKVSEKVNDLEAGGRAKSSLANIYFMLGEDAYGFKLSLEAIKSLKQINAPFALAAAYNNLGNYYHGKRNYDRAYYFYIKSLELRNKIDDKDGIISNLSNIGSVHLERKEYDKAKKYYDDALALSNETGNDLLIAYANDNLSSFYQRTHNFDKAEPHSLITLAAGKKLSSPDLLSRASDYLYRIYRYKKNYLKSLEMLELYKRMSDTLKSENIQKAAFKQQYKREYEKQAEEEKAKANAERERIETKNREEKRIQNIITISVSIGFLLVLILAIVIFRSLQQNKRKNEIISLQKKIVDEKQKEILDSITYARRIQQSLFPTEKYIERNLKKK